MEKDELVNKPNKNDETLQPILLADEKVGPDYQTLHNKIVTIDDILNKIGYTHYHILIIVISAFILIADGAEIYTIYLIAPILRKTYNLPIGTSALLSSCLFIGFGLGSFFSGTITKIYKRRYPMLLSLLVIMLFGTIWVFIDNFWFFIFCRIMVGIGIGILINFLNSLCEILPNKYRDFIMGSIFVFWKLGIIYFCLICYGYMGDKLDKRYWKICTILGVVPNLVCFILILFWYNESPRILFWNDEVDQGFIELEKIASYNKIILTEDEKNGIKDLIAKEKSMSGNNNPCESLGIMLSSPLTALTIIVMLLWFLNSVILYMNHYSFPLIIERLNTSMLSTEKKHKLILELIYANLIPIPAEFLAGAMTATSFFGRKNTISLGFFFQMIFSAIMCFERNYLFVYSSLITFFNVLSWNITKLYTSEVYHTRLRDSAYGFGNAMSRVGGFLVPFISESGFYFISTYGPIYIIFVLCLISLILTLSLPFDTYGKPLDDIKLYDDK